MKKYLFLLIAVMAMVSCTKEIDDLTPNVANEQPELKATKTICGNYERVKRDWFHINNNIWGRDAGFKGVGKQCMWVKDQNSWGCDAKHSKIGSSDNNIKGYPSIIFGDHYGNKTKKGVFPRKVKDLGKMSTSWKFSVKNAAKYNASYDIWFDNSKNPGNNECDYELMIWVKRAGGLEPIAKKYNSNGAVPVGKKTIKGREYNVFYKKGISGHNGHKRDVMSFVAKSGTTNFSTDIKPFVDYCVSKNWLKKSHYCTSVQVGWEIVAGGNFKTTKFSLSN